MFVYIYEQVTMGVYIVYQWDTSVSIGILFGIHLAQLPSGCPQSPLQHVISVSTLPGLFNSPLTPSI